MKQPLAPIELEKAYSFIKDWSAELDRHHGIETFVILFHHGKGTEHAHLRTVSSTPANGLRLIEMAAPALVEAGRQGCGCENCKQAAKKEGTPHESAH